MPSPSRPRSPSKPSTSPLLTVHRHDSGDQAWLTLTGEIDLTSAARLYDAVIDCLHDGIRTVDIDLHTVTFCDCRGVDAVLRAARRAEAVQGMLRLHRPQRLVARLFAITRTDLVLGDLQPGHARAGAADTGSAA